MNLLDRLIATIAPEAGLRRARARAQIGLMRAYEGAQRGRRTQGWRSSATGPKTEVQAGRGLLRQRARDLVRNNGWAARGINVLVANQVGTGIRPRANSADERLNKQIEALFAEWAMACAPESGLHFFAAQKLAVRARSESGESLILLDRSSAYAPAGVPLSLQVLEGDWIDDTTGLQTPGRDGWCDGIRFDQSGRRIAYRLWESAPHEATGIVPRNSREVPARDVIHLYRTDRPGQIRGVPDIASVMLRLRDLDDYHDAALILAKIQACLGVFVTQAGGPAQSTIGQEATDPATGNRVEEIAPGMIAYLAPGEEPHFLAPQGSGPFAEYTRVTLHLIAAAFGLTYHQLTGDLSQANYSSLRAGTLEFRRQVEQDQHLLLIPTMCEPIWRAFLQQAVLAGKLPAAAATAPAIWTPPRFEMVDPNRDTAAAVAQVRAGFMTWPEMVAEFGYDPAQQLAEIRDWTQKLTAAGIILDTDPSKITGTGNPVDPKQLAAIVLAAQGAANA